ncbi:TonB-dependent receptor [candidate division KSB1 bacterium 4572_119]|nr:MAG: TonB-dependent receptor [candidate division KSB1 bacterium 4572_119]
MRKNSIFFVIILLLCFSLSLYAGTVGKITGKVIDDENGLPLPGVNVIIEGTTLGAATDIDGNYVIINVPPGLFSLTFSMIGYTEYRVRDVRVVIDLTTTINANLKQEVLAGEEITVVAERPVVTKDISNSQMSIISETIENLPVQNVQEVLALQAGIEKDREGISVRGGGPNQTVFMLDGLSLNDERSNIPYNSISLSSIKEIQVQTGGFNAEYGNLRSGLVNVVTKEGHRQKYSASLSIRYAPAAAKHFGPSLYDNNSYFTRPYLDPAVCWTGTNNGEPFEDLNENGIWDQGEPFTDYNGDGSRSYWDDYTQRQYPQFEGWNAVSYATMRDDDPTNDLSPEGAKKLFEWQHRRQGDIKKPDFVIDAGFGGPVPFISEKLGNLRFHISHFREQDMFVFPLSRDSYSENHTQLKLTSDISSSMKLAVLGIYSETNSVSPYSWKTTPTGRVLRMNEEAANLVHGSSGASVVYMPGYYSPSDIFRSMIGAKFTHLLSPTTFYEISIQNKISNYDTYQMSDRDTTKRYEILDGYYADEAPYGYWGYGIPGIDGMSMGGWMNLGRDSTVNSTTALKFDMTSQINMKNQVKAGIEIVYNDLNIKSGTYSPSMATWTRNMRYHVFPFRVGSYIQDKLEISGFIANIGIRFDYFDPNADRYVMSEFDKYYGAGYGNEIEESVETEKAKANWDWSPRLGISHPITDNSKLYFNYGHFRAEPSSSYRFRLQRESNGLVTSIGDPNLELEKTVAYELGYAQNLFNEFLLNIAAYYKDVSNQIGWIYYQNVNSTVQYNIAENNNYADIRGFEITLTRQFGRWMNGFLNYTYDVRTSGYFGLRKYYENPTEQRAYEKLNPYQSKPHPRPFARLNMNFHSPEDYGPTWMGTKPLAGWNLNVLAEWKTGKYETYNPNSIPGVVDDVQWKDWHNVDLRLSKLFKISNYNLQFYMDISNVFNYKYMTAGLFQYRNYAGFADDRDYRDYLESLNFSWEEGVEHGNDKVGDYRPVGVEYDPLEANPNNDPDIEARNKRRKENKSYINMPNIESLAFINPRRITFGITINF